MDEVPNQSKKLPLFTEGVLLRLTKDMRDSINRNSRSIGQTANEFIREAIRLHIDNCTRKEVGEHGKSKT